ncbi:MAG TPA: thioredoxin family protein [Nitrososphaeraceae archaeon]|jgi:thioredoxin 1
MKHLEPSQFDNLLSSNERALVMFYADWCPYCQKFKPVFESVVAKQEDKKSTMKGYKMYGSKVNDDDNPLWDRFSMEAVPTLIAFDDRGEIISRRDAKRGIGLNKSDLDSILKEIQ